jgi:hypothetical protein
MSKSQTSRADRNYHSPTIHLRPDSALFSLRTIKHKIPLVPWETRRRQPLLRLELVEDGTPVSPIRGRKHRLRLQGRMDSSLVGSDIFLRSLRRGRIQQCIAVGTVDSDAFGGSAGTPKNREKREHSRQTLQNSRCFRTHSTRVTQAL